jgi:HAE1 family hydrophobic/amphiphilic exporter-1
VTLSDLSIRRPVFAWMLMSGLIIFGAISLSRMGVSQLPDVDFPVLTITVRLNGAAPEVMETEVVDPIEDAVMTVQGVRSVTSSSRSGFANVSIEFELGRDIDSALQEVQTKIAQVQRLLPANLDPPIITKANPEDFPIMWIAVSNDRIPLRALMTYVRDHLQDRFATVQGVGDVFLGGYVEPNLRIWVSRERLAERELAIGDVIQAVQREHLELPAGRLEDPSRLL